MPNVTSADLDTLDRALLNRLQSAVPLVADPFEAIGGELRLTGDDVITRIARLKQAGLIRQIGAIFDTTALGYRSSLVAGRVAEDRLPAAAAVVNEHPGVTHNYRRSGPFNLWFTLAVPPTSRLGLEQTAEILSARSGADVFRLLPAERVFKIGVQFDMSDERTGSPERPGPIERPAPPERADPLERAGPSSAPAPGAANHQTPLSDSDIAIVRLLQDDLLLSRTPFDAPAHALGCSVEKLLRAAADLASRGVLRRFAAVLHHRAAGFAANAMGVWAVPADRAEAVGRRMAEFAQVSHCYQRPTWPDWPFNLFTMVHGHSAAECERVLADIRAATGVERMEILYSLEEYKKTRLRYFTGEIEAWEAANA